MDMNMDTPSYEELSEQLKKAQKEIDKLRDENAQLKAKILEMQWMIKKYIVEAQTLSILSLAGQSKAHKNVIGVNMKYRTILAVAIVLSCIIACKRQPIGTFAYSIPANSAYSQITDKQMHDAITKGLHECGWTFTETSQNLISATLIAKGKHTVFVYIPYSSTHYEIKYKDSAHLKYKRKDDGTEQIHKAYNQWVSTLNRSIQAHLSSTL